MDTLFIDALTLPASIGCLDAEKQRLQTIIIDVSMQVHCDHAARNDDLAATVDYSAIVTRIEQIVTNKHYQLVEHLGHLLCQHLLAEYPIEKITLKIAKPEAIAAAKTVGVIMERSK